jgi:hypothetical protein
MENWTFLIVVAAGRSGGPFGFTGATPSNHFPDINAAANSGNVNS